MQDRCVHKFFSVSPVHSDDIVGVGEIWPDGLTQVRWLQDCRTCIYVSIELLLEQIDASGDHCVSYKHGNEVDESPHTVEVTSVLGVVVF